MAAHDEENHRPRLLNLLIGVTLATIVVALWYLVDYYYLRDSSEAVTWYPPGAGCELLERTCHADLGVSSALSFTLQAVPGRQEPLRFEVEVAGTEATSVEVAFVGRDLDVHSRQFSLHAEADGRFVGQGDLGRCSSHVTAWRAQVTVLGDHGLQGSWFDFDNDQLEGVVKGQS
ncbi:hypothetical protein, partial [Salinicola rhizosphaerae]|uniref:hypothetical protein n=1 Tax=Salinicola rhizosphaerae TaxID=1443141 RepID=UPI00167638AD